MYTKYWKLDRKPFENNGDPEFFFRSETHQASLLKMRYVVENRLGAGLLAGGGGYGKTYLARLLAHELPADSTTIVHIVFPSMSPSELLAYLAIELGANEAAVTSAENGLNRTIRQIEQQLTAHTKQGRHPVLIIDEAHLIDDQRVYQALQLLLNFRQPPKLDFSLLLIGQRTLLSRVSRLASLDERIAAKALLAPFSREETAGYVNHRLTAAGCKQTIFEPPALDVLFELSGGVPRQINRLCDLALLVGCADRLSAITATEIETVGEEIMATLPD